MDVRAFGAAGGYGSEVIGERETGLEPATYSLGSYRSTN